MMQLKNNNESSKEASLPGRISITLFLLVFFSMGAFFLSFMGYSLYREASTHLWTKTECTVISSGIDEENKSGHFKYIFKSNYSYSAKGREYRSDKVSLQYSGSVKYSEAQKLLNKYPAGSKGFCLVNPANPSEAILAHNHSQLLMLPFLAIPLIFILIGGGGIYAIWSRKNISEIIKKNRGGIGRKLPNTVLSLFFSVFLIIGLSVFYSMGVLPAVKLFQSQKWHETPCKIISSSVGSHYDDDGTTYSIDILYSYDYNGRSFRSNTYSFMGGSSSGYSGKQEIVKNYPPGASALCYVSPENPEESVLIRNFTSDMLFGLIPLIFVLVGAVGLYFTLKKKVISDENPAEFDSRELSDYSGGDYELKPIAGPWGSFLGGLLFTLFWNGIVSIFVYIDIQGWMKGRPEWVLTIILTPFVIIGLLCIYGSLSCFISLFNPRIKIRVNSKSVCAGNKLKVQWETNERSAELFRKLIINLKCIRGELSGRNSKKNVVSDIAIIETEDPYRIASGGKDIIIPENSLPSNDGTGGEKIYWLITLTGILKARPKINMEYPIRVLGSVRK